VDTSKIEMPKSKALSLSERLAALTDPQPVVVDKEVEDEDTVTGARVVDGEEDEDEQGMESNLGRSKLRAAAEGLLEGDARYRGKKGSRRTLDQDLDGPLDQDMKEHMQAELGHMFGGGEDEDGEEEDEEDEGNEDEGSDSEEEEDDGEEDSEDDDDCEDEQILEDDEEEAEEEDEVMEENERVEKKAFTGENPDREFSFNPNKSFSEYGEEMEGDSEDEEDDDEDEKLNNEDSEEESENEDEEDDQMEEDEGPVKPGALMREKESSDRVKASAVVEQLATWDSLLEQRILLQKLLTRASTFPNSLGSFVEGKEHEKEVRVAGRAVEKVVRSSGEVCRLLPGGEAESLQAGDSEAAARWLGSKHRKLESGRRAGVSKWEVKTSKIGGFNSLHTPALTQVDQVMAVPGRVVGRTRVKRSEYRVLGADQQDGEEEEEDPEVFDDSDFYHTLLRDLIDRKTGGGGAEGDEGRQWLKVQRLRSKMKKKVDTRASKGRKVRYDIHSKLVNFMAPVPALNQWQDSAKNELFSSLFGVRRVPTNAA